MAERAVQHVELPVAGRSFARPFVGRTQELADLAAALGDAADGHGSLLLLTGEPGIGTTRLMGELAQVAGGRGLRVVTGRCWASASSTKHRFYCPDFWARRWPTRASCSSAARSS